MLNNTLKKELFSLGDDLFTHPELGFKEVQTRQILIDFFLKHGVEVDQTFAHTGFSVRVGSGHPHIALIAELDAVITQQHPNASSVDGAAHSCGHSTQCTLMAGAFIHLKQTWSHGTLTLFFTPAEEFVDLEFRRELKQKGMIKAFGGKQEMLLNHVFYPVDLVIHAHGMGESKYRYSVYSSLAGFIYKEFTFSGKSAHAAVMPHLGLNALNMFTLFNTAVGLLRETFVDEDKNRFHGHLKDPGNSINSISDKVVYESYVRSFDPEGLKTLSQQLTHTALHCAQSLNGSCQVIDTVGYLPMIPSETLSKVAHEILQKYCSKDKIITHERSIAAGDIGDVSMFKPTIQLGYSGFSGNMHGSDLQIKDKELIYSEMAQVMIELVQKLMNTPQLVDEIVKSFKPLLSYAEYQERFK